MKKKVVAIINKRPPEEENRDEIMSWLEANAGKILVEGARQVPEDTKDDLWLGSEHKRIAHQNKFLGVKDLISFYTTPYKFPSPEKLKQQKIERETREKEREAIKSWLKANAGKVLVEGAPQVPENTVGDRLFDPKHDQIACQYEKLGLKEVILYYTSPRIL